ncbi:MAG: nicotinate (nicotinamide) nucleotide adenylyltransferase [Bdellovibrionota bacterium]
MTAARQEIIVFGGTFDPPHQGHIECVELVLENFPNAKVWIIPSASPAFARHSKEKTPHYSYEDRLQLCRLAFQDNTNLPKNKIIISDIENSAIERNYTINTLKKISDLNPSAKIFFLIGQDQLESFSKWYKPKEILEIASLIAVSRPNSDHTTLNKLTEKLANDLMLQLDWNQTKDIAKLGKEKKYNVFLFSTLKNDVASSKIWHYINSHESIPDAWLPESIKTIIEKNMKGYK